MALAHDAHADTQSTGYVIVGSRNAASETEPKWTGSRLETLLADCRVTDVQRMPGVHPDRDATTGQPLLFKAGAPIH